MRNVCIRTTTALKLEDYFAISGGAGISGAPQGLVSPAGMASPAKTGEDLPIDMAAIEGQIQAMLRALPRQNLDEPKVSNAMLKLVTRDLHRCQDKNVAVGFVFALPILLICLNYNLFLVSVWSALLFLGDIISKIFVTKVPLYV